MFAKSISALAVLAFAVNGLAEPMPYKPQMLKSSSVRDMFFVRREDVSVYRPTQAMCNQGHTCAEACGDGYATCSSGDSQVHCYNPQAAETCCPDGSGNSCDAGFYCTSDTTSDTYCCPNAMDVVACAKAYNLSGGLVKQTPKPTSSMAPYPTSWPSNSTVTDHESVTSCTSTVLPSGTWPSSNYTSVSVGPPSPSKTKVVEGAGNMFAPASALALIVAGAAALL